MTSKPQKKSSRPGVALPFYRRRNLIIIVAFALVVLPLLWLAVRNETYYAGDKQKINSDVVALLGDVQSSRPPVYSAVVDQGCDDKGSVGLATSTVCKIAGYKYYEATGSVASDMQDLDSLVQRQGWYRAFPSPADQQILDGTTGGSISYRPNSANGQGVNPYLDLTVYRGRLDDTTIDGLIQSGKMQPLVAGSVIYGIHVTENYWSCTDQSLLKLPCPSPPSNPNQ